MQPTKRVSQSSNSHTKRCRQRHRDMALGLVINLSVEELARDKAHGVGQDSGEKIAHSAVTFAKERNFERDAVTDERALLTDALRRSMGGARWPM